MNRLTRRQKITYFSLALVAWMLFQHGLGPWLGLTGLERRIWAYVFAIMLATGYLYMAIWRHRPSIEETNIEDGKS